MKRWAPWLTSLALVLLVLWARGDRERPPFRERRLLMDTLVTITVQAPPGTDPAQAAGVAFARIAEVEAVFSRYRPEAAVGRLNAAGELADAPAELLEVLADAQALSTRAQGLYDPTLGAVATLWGFGPGAPDDSERRPPDPEALAAALVSTGPGAVTTGPGRLALAEGVALDLGGFAKGYAVDQAVEALRGAGVAALVDAGGDMACTGPKLDGSPWRVGVRHPRNRNALLGVVALAGGAVATSGDYERFFEFQGTRYHHLLDPATGRPARHHTQVTVRAPTCAQADAWATALFVASPAEAPALAKAAGLEAFWVPSEPEGKHFGDLVLGPVP